MEDSTWFRLEEAGLEGRDIEWFDGGRMLRAIAHLGRARNRGSGSVVFKCDVSHARHRRVLHDTFDKRLIVVC
jgi:hypothetical protein